MLIDAGLLQDLDHDELVGAVCHELAHARRWDLFVGPLLHLCYCLLSFFPAARHCYARYLDERELAADAWAVRRTRRPLALASAIVKAEIREAEANRARAEAERTTLEGEISLAIQEAHAAATVARQQVDLFRETYLPQAEQLLDNAQRRYQAGEGTGIEVAKSHRALRETVLQREQAVLEYREALVQLERTSGVRLLQ